MEVLVLVLTCLVGVETWDPEDGLTLCCPLQAPVSSALQHLTPRGWSEISSGGLGQVPQKDAALEPESLQKQQAGGVRRQSRAGDQHGLGGVLTPDVGPLRELTRDNRDLRTQ